MADIFIKNPSGAIWKNSEGKILKAKRLNEMPIQQGLSFWGAAYLNYLTIVDGYVSEAYDIRGIDFKLIQPTVSDRGLLSSNYIYFNGWGDNSLYSQAYSTIRSSFLIAEFTGGSGQMGVSVGANSSPFIGAYNGGIIEGSSSNNINRYYYINDVKNFRNLGNGFSYQLNTKYIISSLSDLNTYGIPRVGVLSIFGGVFMKVYEFGWYNRLLTEMEVIYNINALNTKYQIF